VRGCSTYNTTSSGIAAWRSTDILIEGNDIELACNDGEQECLTVARTSTFRVLGNHIHHSGPGSIGGEGIDAKDGCSDGLISGNHVHHISRLGIYVDAWDEHTHDIEVSANLVHDCDANGMAVAAEAGGLLERVRVVNNIVSHNDNVGLTVAGWGEPVPSHPISGVEIVNNTFFENGDGWGGGIAVENPDAEDIVIRNNIFGQNLSFQILVEVTIPGLAIDHNLIDGFRGDPDEVRGTDYREGPPGFVDPASVDLHLTSGALAVDCGSPDLAPATDHDGNPRPSGPGYDMGAFELAVPIFADDFESGDTTRWSAAVP
jgi:hypothetical protein